MFTQVSKHVAMVAKDITGKEFDAIFVAQLVNLHKNFLGAACQTDLEREKHPQGNTQSSCSTAPPPTGQSEGELLSRAKHQRSSPTAHPLGWGSFIVGPLSGSRAAAP